MLTAVGAAIEQAGPDPAARLRAGLTAFVEATLADERGARVNYFEMVGVSRELGGPRRRVLSDYAELIAAQAQGGDHRRGPARWPAVALVGATDGLIIDWLSGDRTSSSRSIVDTLLAIFAPVVGG